MNRKIYIYTTETYKANGWYKIGETSQSVEERVEQQDGTSNPESLLVLTAWKSPNFSDKDFHRFLEKNGCSAVRQDRSREWYHVPGGVKQICTLYNQMAKGIARPNSYKMRPEQQEGHDKAVSFFRNGGQKFLFAAVMRYGKCFTSLELCRELKYRNILLLTWKPQVSDSWKEDIRDHVNYDGWQTIQARDPSAPEKLAPVGTTALFPTLVYESFQELTNTKGRKKVEWIFEQQWDLIILDEEHYGIKTANSRAILSQFPGDQRYLSLSGTPFESLAEGEFDDDSTYKWTYTEEARVRLAQKEGGWVTDTHRCLPELHFRGIHISSKVIDKFESKGFVGDHGFNIKKIWAMNPLGGFLYPTQVRRLLDALAEQGDVGKTCLSPYNMDELGDDSLKLLDHTFWYLPPDVKAIAALATMLSEHDFFGDYVIINASGRNVKDINKAKSIIKHRNKTITLSCGRFNTGVSVPQWGAVFMFDGGTSAADYWQTIFRIKTPWAMKTDEVTGKVTQWKEVVNVFDFDPHRMNQVIYDNCVGTKSARETTEESLKSFFEVASITHLGEFKTIKVDANHLLEAAASRGRGLGAFGSARAVNPFTISEDLVQIFGNLSKGAARKLVDHIGDTKLQKGKISTTTSQNKKAASKEKQQENQKKIKDLQQKLQQAVSRIPTYLMIDYDKQINSCDDLILEGDQKLFKSVTGYTLQNFKDALQVGCIRQEWIDSSIVDMNLRINKLNLEAFLSGNNNIFSVLGAFERDGKSETPGTPGKLVFEMLDRLPRDIWSNPHKTFFDPACSTGTILLEVFRRLYNGLEEVFKDPAERVEHILTRQIYGNEETIVPYRMTRAAFGVLLGNQFDINKMNLSSYNILKKDLEKMKKKFDVVVMNPPYQIKVGPKKTEPIWQKFVLRMADHLEDGGFMCAIHPTGWRAPSGRFDNVKKYYQSKKLLFLSTNDFNTGADTFGVGTAYDWVVVQNQDNDGTCLTEVVDEAEITSKINLTNWKFIPGGKFDEFKRLIDDTGEDSVRILHSYSAYETRKEHINPTQNKKYCHKCVYTITQRDGMTYRYSETKDNGHFDVPKVIWSNGGGTYPVVDASGDYGLTQFSYAIVDAPENLEKIAAALKSEKIVDLMKLVQYTAHKYNHKVLGTFKKNFWELISNED